MAIGLEALAVIHDDGVVVVARAGVCEATEWGGIGLALLGGMRFIRLRRAVGVLIVFGAAHIAGGCDATKALGDDGDAGADAGGGMDGGGMDGGGEASVEAGAVVSVGSCLEALFADCRIDGDCRSNATPSSLGSQFCFAGGAQASYGRSGGCAGDGRTVLEVRKADGALCYTSEISQGTLCESENFMWKDASGRVIATGSSGVGYRMFRCADSGERFTCDDGRCDFGSVWATRECESGGCP